MANGKQINMVLELIQTNDSISTYSETYHFKPENEELKKRVTLKVSGGTDILAILDTLGLPKGKSDSVVVEIGAKIVQSKLIQAEKKEEDSEQNI